MGESIDFPYDKSKEIVMADGIKRSMKKGCVYCDKTGDSNVITEDDAPSANLLGAAYALPDKQTVACFNPKTNGKLTLTVSGWRKNSGHEAHKRIGGFWANPVAQVSNSPRFTRFPGYIL